ncbi:MAG: hypothetical protein ACPHID_07415 [Thermoplasmatota archaeon]
MDVIRTVDAFCASCNDITSHAITHLDPGSCFCNACGAAQLLYTPLAPVEA